MQSYTIEKVTDLNVNDYNAILQDSRSHEWLIDTVLDALSFDHIQDFSWVRVYQDRCQFHVLTSLSLASYQAYMQTKLWCYDFELLPCMASVYYETDYMSLLDKVEVSEGHLRRMQSRVTIYFAKGYQGYTDIFTFDLPKNAYSQYSHSDKMALYERLNVVVRLLYSSINFQMKLLLVDPIIVQYATSQDLASRLKDKYQLTDADLDVLTFLATGCTAKEIAQHVGKSYRTVQDRIVILMGKLRCRDKAQLSYIAQILMSYTHTVQREK